MKLVCPRGWKPPSALECAGTGDYCGHPKSSHENGVGACRVSNDSDPDPCWCTGFKPYNPQKMTDKIVLRRAQQARDGLASLAMIVRGEDRKVVLRLLRELKGEIKKLSKGAR